MGFRRNMWIQFKIIREKQKIASSKIIKLPKELTKKKWLSYDEHRDAMIGTKRLDIEELLELGFETKIQLFVVPRLTKLLQQNASNYVSNNVDRRSMTRKKKKRVIASKNIRRRLSHSPHHRDRRRWGCFFFELFFVLYLYMIYEIIFLFGAWRRFNYFGLFVLCVCVFFSFLCFFLPYFLMLLAVFFVCLFFPNKCIMIEKSVWNWYNFCKYICFHLFIIFYNDLIWFLYYCILRFFFHAFTHSLWLCL